MTPIDAIARAKEVANKRRWTWNGKGSATKGGILDRLVYNRGRPVWVVYSHQSGMGCQVRVVLDAKTGRILREGFCPK